MTLPAALPAALVVFTTTTSPQLPSSPLLPPHVERGVSPAVLSRCDAGSECRTSPLTLPSSPKSYQLSPPPITGKIITFGTVLLVLHRTLYGRVSVIFSARVAGIYPHYNGIPQRGATRYVSLPSSPNSSVESPPIVSNGESDLEYQILQSIRWSIQWSI